MTSKVKICGLMNKADIDVAIDGGADFIGLAFFAPSPRNLTLSEAASLAEHARGRTQIVALTVDGDDALIQHIAREVRPDFMQLHGSENLERVEQVAALSGCRIIKVVKVQTADDAEPAFAYRAAGHHILFDAKAPADAKLPGGNGLRFDWHALAGVKGRLDYMLSGGLTAENVAEAIRLTGAVAVDVSSGVERAPGEKDPARIRAFLKAAKGL